jgi:arginase family enzyme
MGAAAARAFDPGAAGRLAGADLVELNPSRDPEGVTAMVAAKLLKEMAARMLRDWVP